MLKAMLHDAMSLINLQLFRSGIKCIFICSQIGVTVSRSGFTTFQVPEQNHRHPEKNLISNLFLDSLKKSERSKVWKFIHL